MPMRRRLAALLAAGALISATGCSGAADPGSSTAFPAAPFLSTTTDGGSLHLDVRTAPSQPPQRGTSSWSFTLADAASSRAADGLSLQVVPWMPYMNHGTSVTPVVEAQGNGVYLVTEVSLFMPGRWDLRTTIGGTVSDHVIVSADVP